MYSRREFGRLALAGLPMTVAFAQGSSKINSSFNGVRIGCSPTASAGLPLDDAIKAMAGIGIGECELFSGHVEPRIGPPPGRDRPQGPTGTGSGEMTPEMREAMREAAANGRKRRASGGCRSRLIISKDVRKKFDAAGIKLQAYNLSFNDNFTDEEIDRGFQMAEGARSHAHHRILDVELGQGLRPSPRNIRSPSPCTVIPI